MADLNELIKSAKQQQVAGHSTCARNTDTASGTSRPQFKEDGAQTAPPEADTATNDTTDSMKGKDPRNANERKRTPSKNRNTLQIQDMSEDDIADFLRMIGNRKRSRKTRKGKAVPVEITELREKCQAFMEGRQNDDWALNRLHGETHTILTLFCKVCGIQSQQLASFIIMNYLEDNFADFVKKIRSLGF